MSPSLVTSVSGASSFHGVIMRIFDRVVMSSAEPRLFSTQIGPRFVITRMLPRSGVSISMRSD
jgi:hypothetical protein